MDPLSIIASTIAIATPVSVALQKLRRIRQSKSDLLLLSNEVADTLILLRELDQVFRQPRHIASVHPDPILVQALADTKSKLQALSDDICSSGDPDVTTRERASRWFTISSSVRQFKEEMRRNRSQLMTILSSLNLYDDCRTAFENKSIMLTSSLRSGSTRIEMSLQDVFLLTRDTSDRQILAQQEFQTQMSSKYDGLQALLTGLHLNDHDADRQTHNTGQESTNSPSQGSNGSRTVTNEDRVKAFHHNGSILYDSSTMTAVSAVGIRTSQFPRTSCTPWCSCACHKEWRFRTPRFLEAFVGSLFIGYSGIPVLRPPCNEHSCHLRSQPLTYVTYFFPRWFLSRMVTVMLTNTPLAGPVASLKVQRTVPGYAEIFNYAKLGNLDGIKSLFEGGLASPHDVQYDSGITALHVSFYDTNSLKIKLIFF